MVGTAMNHWVAAILVRSLYYISLFESPFMIILAQANRGDFAVCTADLWQIRRNGLDVHDIFINAIHEIELENGHTIWMPSFSVREK